jgi:hypothetical protein
MQYDCNIGVTDRSFASFAFEELLHPHGVVLNYVSIRETLLLCQTCAKVVCKIRIKRAEYEPVMPLYFVCDI